MLRDAADAASVGGLGLESGDRRVPLLGTDQGHLRTRQRKPRVSYADLQAQTVAADRDRMESALRIAFDPAGTGGLCGRTQDRRSNKGSSVSFRLRQGLLRGTYRAHGKQYASPESCWTTPSRGWHEKAFKRPRRLASVPPIAGSSHVEMSTTPLHVVINLLGIIRWELDPKQREMLVRLAESELGSR